MKHISKHKKLMVRLQRLATLLNEFVEKDMKMEDLVFDPARVDNYWKLLEENLWKRKMEFDDGDRWTLIWVLYESLKGVWGRFNKARDGLIFCDHDSLIEHDMEVVLKARDARGSYTPEDANDPVIIPYELLFEADLIMFMQRLRRCKDDKCRRWFPLPKKLKKEGDRWVTLPCKREKEYCCQRHASRYYQKMKRTKDREKYNEDQRKYRAERKSNLVPLMKEHNET